MAKTEGSSRDIRGRHHASDDTVRFIEASMPLAPVPSLPEIRFHTAHAGSGLGRFAGREAREGGRAPYWAFVWAGGAALARHVLNRPDIVAGRRVLDLGAGSGIVAIAAARAGASTVLAADIDPDALIALALNAAANNVVVTSILEDPTGGPPPAVELVAVGDLFYERSLAMRVTAFLDSCLQAGMEVLIGDPGRAHLPRSRLQLLAEYPVPDVGDGKRDPLKPSFVFALKA